MTQKLIFDKWLHHDGKGCPVPVGYMVDVEGHWPLGISAEVFKATRQTEDIPAIEWFHDEVLLKSAYTGYSNAIITRYRIHKLKGMEQVNEALNNLPADDQASDCIDLSSRELFLTENPSKGDSK